MRLKRNLMANPVKSKYSTGNNQMVRTSTRQHKDPSGVFIAFSQAMASTPPGRSAQPRDTQWALQGTATRRAASSTAGLRGAARVRQAFLLSRQVGFNFPLVGRRSRGIRGGPSRERLRAGQPAPPQNHAGLSVCAWPSSSPEPRVVRSSDGLDSLGWPAQLPDAVGHQGTSDAGQSSSRGT
jgi:hypothetical protein